MYIQFLKFEKGSEVCVRQRETEKDLKRLLQYMEKFEPSLYTKWTSVSASLFGKSTQAHNGSTRATLLTLSVSLIVSGSVSLTMEVVIIGPESHISHTYGGAAFV